MALAAAEREFWNEKKTTEWSKEEIDQFLKESPWAKDASISFNAGPGSTGWKVGRGSRATPERVSIENEKFKGTVRWESALPVREATHTRASFATPSEYAIKLIGDLPMLGAPSVEEKTAEDERMEMMRSFTKLDRRRGPIYLNRATFQGAEGATFYFTRMDPILASDKQVTFTTKLGPLEVKARFTLKDMMYRGKLEL